MAEIRQERALRTREVLLRAAAEEFDEKGYAAALINQILARAGLTAGAMYFHFKSKEDLAVAVMNAQRHRIEPGLNARGLQRLVDITLVWAHQLRVDPLLRAGVRLAVEQGSFGMHDASTFLEWREIMVGCLADAESDKELMPGVVPADIAEFVVGACTGIQLYANLVNGREDLVERTVRMWELLLPGIAVPSAARRISLDAERGRVS
ncbi:ScbR family autoregulator-binding transcription factor [Streptomyces violascens]|uniref:Gamma-butyrolactone-binding protein n=1 Tax=Streptomyces violascens TaxID=67381 RepID=A0ABQ3QXY9_9ACTN|nr:ScbR family autoregulator-binding transcription factor [Streptomyces violascens]GGU18718.1 gamma-butyrolactone-binding protein [Streptomyces violascens]GHI42146.1 gamma-butyrolactone-binding protein [Streptomyces violascens]